MTVKSQSPQAIIYHDRCRDGTCGLCVVNQYLKSLGHQDNLLIAGTYQGYENIFNQNLKNHEIYFVDFSLYPSDMAKLAANSKKITVLDHHDGVLEQYAQYVQKNGEYFTGKFLPNVDLVFDKQRSGALLAWDYLIKTPAPDFVKYISDADIYEFKLDGTKDFSARMGMEEDTLQSYEQLIHMSSQHMERFLGEGRILEKQFEQMCQKAAKKSTPIKITIDGKEHLGDLAVSSTEISNRVAEIIYNKNHTFAVIMTQVLPDQYKLSLRAKAPSLGEETYDVKEIACYFGGNGHSSAAGCYVDKMKFEQHFTFLKFSDLEKISKNKLK